jgi:uncharacterized protein involved in exopolysaccharide biosynthesis
LVQNNNLQEDEIDLKELFLTIWNYRKFIVVFTLIILIAGVIYSNNKKNIYEVKAVIEVGKFSNKNNDYIENPQNLIKKLEIEYIENTTKKQNTVISSVSLINLTKNLIQITSQAETNNDAIVFLNEIVKKLVDKHKVIIDGYRNLILENIKNLKYQKDLLEKKNDKDFALKFDLISKIRNLELSITPYNVKETKQIGDFIKNNEPIKPIRKLIITTSFLIGFILSIFLVFFIEFIKGLKKDKS